MRAFKTAQKEDSMFVDLEEFKEVLFNLAKLQNIDLTLDGLESFIACF